MAVGLGITVVVTMPILPLAMLAFIVDPGGPSLLVDLAARLFAAPAAVLGGFAAAFVGVLLAFRQRPVARGRAIQALGVTVLTAMVVTALLAAIVFGDPGPSTIVVAWLIWPGVTLVREGIHLSKARS